MKSLILSLVMLLLASGCTVTYRTIPTTTATTTPRVVQPYNPCRWVPGHYEYRRQVVRTPGKWVIRTNRNGVRYKVWVPGSNRVETRRVWVPGRRVCR